MAAEIHQIFGTTETNDSEGRGVMEYDAMRTAVEMQKDVNDGSIYVG